MKKLAFVVLVIMFGVSACGVKGKPQAPLEKTYIGNSQLPKRK